MGGMIAPMPVIGKPAGRAMTDIATLGTAELLPGNIKKPLFNGMGSVFFSPAALAAGGGAGLMGAGGIAGGGMGAAAPGAAGLGTPAAGSALIGSELGQGSALPAITGAGGAGGAAGPIASEAAKDTAGGGMFSGPGALQNAFLATSIGSMLGNAFSPPPTPGFSIPAAPIGHGGGFTPVASGASQQWAQLMAQRRGQQLGKFTG